MPRSRASGFWLPLQGKVIYALRYMTTHLSEASAASCTAIGRSRFAPAVRRATSMLIVGVCVSTGGCHRCDTTWSAEARSPDGKVVATASTVACSGFGTGVIDTNVSLNWAGDSRPAQVVLGFSDDYEAPEKTMVGMRWLAPTHLEVTYRGPRDVRFQAIKWATIEISLRDLAAEVNSIPR